jgi:ubiquinone biosynthesis protein
MTQFLLAVIALAAAVVVVRRLVGIRRGRWAVTLVAILVAEAATVELTRSVYGPVRDVPGRAWIGAYALVIVFSVLGVMLLEILFRHRLDRRSRGFPHPIRGVHDGIYRLVRYGQVLTIWIHHGLIHADHDGDISGSRLGRSLRRSFEDAGGLFVKLGQAMAEQPQLVTPAVANELAPLQEAAAPADLTAARAVITADIGPPDEIFAAFEEAPLGAASIAQTYAARLHDGRDVVVKVQRPGIAQTVERDLDILRRLADRFDRRTSWARAIGLKELVRGFDERTHEELDFRVEAYNEAYAAKSIGDADVVVPPVIDGFSTARVLVEERAPGHSVVSKRAFDGIDAGRRRQLADALLSLLLRQMLSGEPFHGDPHPGNVFLRPDGRLELIDFGAVGRLDAYERAAFLDMLRGVQEQDPTLIREGVLRIGLPAESVDEEALDRELARLLSSGLKADGRLDPQMFGDLLFVLRDFRIVLPRSTTTLLRAFMTLLGTLEVISPGYRVTDAAQRLSGDLLATQQVPRNLNELIHHELIRNASVIDRFPREVDSLVRVLTRGDFRTRLRLFSDDHDIRVVSTVTNRLAMALVASALSIASAILLATGSAPQFHGQRVVNLLGAVGLFFGVVLIVRLVVQMVRETDT